MIGDFARPRERRPDLPEPLEQIILHAMALEPGASAGERDRARARAARVLPPDVSRPRERQHVVARAAARMPTPPPATGRHRQRVAARPGSDHGRRGRRSAPRSVPATESPQAPVARARGRSQRRAGRACRGSSARCSLVAGIAAAVVVAGAAMGRRGPGTAGRGGTAAPSRSPRGARGATGDAARGAAGDAAAAHAVRRSRRRCGRAAPPAPPGPGDHLTLRFAVEPAGAVITVDGDARSPAPSSSSPRTTRSTSCRSPRRATSPHDETDPVRREPAPGRPAQARRRPGASGDRHKPHPNRSVDRIDSESPY